MDYNLLPFPSQSFFAQHPSINPIFLTILWQRGIRNQEKINEFLEPDYGQNKYDPFKFKEMKKVVKRILKAAQNKERVLVYGDYDADGVCSSVLMVETLEKLYGLRAVRQAQDLIQVYLPHREEEGYGLNLKAIEYIKQKKIQLLITCDCGSTNIEELLVLAQNQIDVIVIDHHIAAKKRPPVYGFINPKFEAEAYPFRQLSAGGVVFKVIQALKISESFEKWALDLVAISTVADVMPLLGENRVLVKWGLVVLNKTRRLGLLALIRAAQIKKQIETYEIGFMIGPRINAAGRLDHANIAFDLLRQREKAPAEKEAEKLNKTNESRQKMTELIFKECEIQIKPQIENKDRILIAYDLKADKWPVGLLGLAAGRLTDKFNRPAFVISLAEHGLSGSGRSIEGFDVMIALDQVKNLFSKYGGHPQACGFTFKSQPAKVLFIRQFKQKLEKYARQKLKDDDLIPRTQVSAEIKLTDITWELMSDIKRMEPFGQDNPRPVFLTKNAKVRSVRTMGIKNDHIKIILEQNQVEQEAVFFRCQEYHKQIKHGDIIDIIYCPEINEWHGRQTIQLVVKDVKV